MKKERNWFGIFIYAMLVAFAVLLCLKLCNAIGWSWIWVASPLWVIAAIFVLLIILYTIVVVKNWDKEDDNAKV